MTADQPSPRGVVTETCEETLNAYSANPSLVRSDGNGEEKGAKAAVSDQAAVDQAQFSRCAPWSKAKVRSGDQVPDR